MAAGKYKLRDGEKVRLTRAAIETATVIEAGDLVAMSSGYIIKAVAGSTAIAWCPDGHAANTGTSIEVTVGNDFTLQGTLDAVFAITYKGGEYNIESTTQLIDLDASSTDVLKIGIGEDAGVVGSASDVTVKINKPLF